VLLVEAESKGLSVIEPALAGLNDTEMTVERAEAVNQALEVLSQGGVDLLLLDLDLPDQEDLGTFERVRTFAPDVPIVVLTRIEDEEMALTMVKSGAQDYLVKGEASTDLLHRSIRYAVERHRLTSALRSLSLIDDLTGLYNRRGFTELGEQHLMLARRSGRAVLLVYLDVDNLKRINDSHGHQAGDAALRRVADMLRETFRQSDIIARIGGDEFVVMALEASEENEAQLLERLRTRAREVDRVAKIPYDLSFSAGAARYSGDDPITLEELLAEVDEAMYQEKWSKKDAGSSPRGAHVPAGEA